MSTGNDHHKFSHLQKIWFLFSRLNDIRIYFAFFYLQVSKAMLIASLFTYIQNFKQ